MDIGLNIKNHRKKLGLTQVQLARLSNISRTYLADIERNRNNPSVETLTELAKALQVSVSTLLGEPSEPEAPVTAKEAASSEEGGTYINILGKDGTHRRIYVPQEKVDRLQKLLEGGLPELMEEKKDD